MNIKTINKKKKEEEENEPYGVLKSEEEWMKMEKCS